MGHVLCRQGGSKMAVDSFRASKNAKLIYDGGLSFSAFYSWPNYKQSIALAQTERQCCLQSLAVSIFIWLGVCKCRAAVSHAVLGPMYVTRSARWGSGVSLSPGSVVVKCLTDFLLCAIRFDEEDVSWHWFVFHGPLHFSHIFDRWLLSLCLCVCVLCVCTW